MYWQSWVRPMSGSETAHDAKYGLQEPSTRPEVPYLASCAVSLPLIGLTQLCQYIV
jgi:hypothetical protein